MTDEHTPSDLFQGAIEAALNFCKWSQGELAEKAACHQASIALRVWLEKAIIRHAPTSREYTGGDDGLSVGQGRRPLRWLKRLIRFSAMSVKLTGNDRRLAKDFLENARRAKQARGINDEPVAAPGKHKNSAEKPSSPRRSSPNWRSIRSKSRRGTTSISLSETGHRVRRLRYVASTRELFGILYAWTSPVGISAVQRGPRTGPLLPPDGHIDHITAERDGATCIACYFSSGDPYEQGGGQFRCRPFDAGKPFQKARGRSRLGLPDIKPREMPVRRR